MSVNGSLDRLLESVSDGTPVDWAGAETAAEGSERARVGALRAVARIVEFNRELQRAPGPLGAPTPDAGPTRWGPLTLLERIGAGTNGAVWRAWDATLEREVALKFLDTPTVAGDDPAALLNEARALARVRHRGVVAVHGIATHDGRTGLWMELLRGRTLADRIDRGGALPAGEVVRLGRELAAALAAVDGAGLVHRDLKPANVLIEPDGRVVLTDFGLGARRDGLVGPATRASGTPVFMAPEVLNGAMATHRSDIYALGVTLWWALAGRPPFVARTLEELKREAAAGPAVGLARVAPESPRALVTAIERAISPDPAQRWGAAEELAAALDAVTPSGAGAAKPATAVRRGILAAAALLALVAGAVWLAPRLTPPNPDGGPDPGKKPAAGAPTTAAPAATMPLASPSPSAAGAEAGSALLYTVEATLLGRSEETTRRLAAGDRVRPGDQLSLEFRASRRMWVYVLNEDERGETYLLFPQPLFDRANPLPTDSTLVLPGTIGGRENAWTVTSRGGREHFLIVAGTEPLPEIEAELARLPAVTPDRTVRYARVGAATMERLRGVGGVAPVPATPTPRRAGAFERFEALAGRETVTRPVWVRRITLRNP